jgi:predicted GNAT family acetyltransferase
VAEADGTATELRVRRFEDASAFLAAAGDFLSSREAEHNLLLGLAGALVQRPRLYGDDPYFAAAFRGGSIVGAALRTPPHDLVLSEVDDPAAVDALAANALTAYEKLPGVLGPKKAARRFSELWAGARGVRPALGVEQRIFRADEVRTPDGVAGAMRRADERNRSLLVKWIHAFQDEVATGRIAGRPAENVVEDRLGAGNTGGFCLWEHGGPVSLAGFGGPTPNGIRIGPVYTPPEYRGRGYASALTAELTSLLLASGWRFCFLFTDLGNPTSNRIYQRIGYEPVTDVDEYRFGE